MELVDIITHLGLKEWLKGFQDVAVIVQAKLVELHNESQNAKRQSYLCAIPPERLEHGCKPISKVLSESFVCEQGLIQLVAKVQEHILDQL